MMWEQDIKSALAALSNAGVPVLVLKGTALAYSLYPQPYLRTRCDTDLWVPKVFCDQALKRLEGLGYRRQEGISGELVSSQTSLVKESRVGVRFCIDLHWRLNNSQLFAQALEQEEADSQAVPLPALGPHAKCLCPQHALLLACMHRAGHLKVGHAANGETFDEGNRLIWLYDIHLLVGSMSAEELEAFARLAVDRRMAAVCRDALVVTGSQFSTSIPDPVLQLLSGPRGEPSARYLSSGAYGIARAELGSLSWPQRLRLLREHLFPPVEYMRWKYGGRNDFLLPVLYCHRAAKGLWTRLVGR